MLLVIVRARLATLQALETAHDTEIITFEKGELLTEHFSL